MPAHTSPAASEPTAGLASAVFFLDGLVASSLNRPGFRDCSVYWVTASGVAWL
jgi:hypothetical protein